MFEREHHIRIATLLQSLNADLLKSSKCYFGGGTAISLSHNEYRESVDIDFLISDREFYRKLRQELKGDKNLKAIVRDGFELITATDIRADQYGIRTMLLVGGTEIKFEIVAEGRIQLEQPGVDDKICGITTLTPLDMAASKLLANSDRWNDRSVFSRDLIDLAMLDLSPQTLSKALKKAESAYGDTVKSDLQKAIQNLKDKPSRLDECMEALKMDSIPKALLWKKIRSLTNLRSGG
ncbi:MAG: nucleotidyl transferase AbiEii/AbiGii toxin family protein [Bdellovibrionales bacterium]|nr:nucleotidyl transferase AbiEii/AbiGii toxin family protein [Bdellovibrionales bacterium]